MLSTEDRDGKAGFEWRYTYPATLIFILLGYCCLDCNSSRILVGREVLLSVNEGTEGEGKAQKEEKELELDDP